MPPIKFYFLYKIPIKKIITLITIIEVIISIHGYSQSVNTENKRNKESKSTAKWTTDPFDQHVFILNNGQFNGHIPGNAKILYGAQLGKVWAYFTNKGVVYSYTKYKQAEKGKDPDQDANTKPSIYYLNSDWENTNLPDIEAKDELSYYYTYPKGTNGTIRTNVFRKITYKNIYPGIDIEYSFLKGKEGIKYTIIAHPGADISVIKLKYTGAHGMKLDSNGNITFNSKLGVFTDHAPISYYGEGSDVKISYKLNGNTESFGINSEYDKGKTLIIDPWITNPLFTPVDAAYDLDWDNNGNVYAYGGSHTNGFQLTKMNSSGAIQWTFSSPSSWVTYGGFCINRTSGTSYLVQGVFGGEAQKVSNSGNLLATYSGNPNLDELWRAKFDPCTDSIIIGGGNYSNDPFQVATMDTNLTVLVPVNALGTTYAVHDIELMALDPNGKQFYALTALPFFHTLMPLSQWFGNVLMQIPLVPHISPANYIVPANYGFLETSSVRYTGGGGNGMNGAAASFNWVYLYNGDTLKQCNKSTGAINAQYSIRLNSPFQFGGLDVDPCDNIVAGVADSVYFFNSTLSITNKIQLPDTVYDIHLGRGNAIYACGKGYVTQLVNPLPTLIDTVTTSNTSSSCSVCNGTATANINATCDPGPFSYHWSNGATTSTITGLCQGTYTITVTDSSTCPPRIDSAVVTVNGGTGPTVNMTFTNATNCTPDGSATANASNGISPYTYSWSPGGQTTATVTGLSAGNYTVTVSDSSGCRLTATVDISQPSTLNSSVNFTLPTCYNSNNGTATVTATGGVTPYTYLWAPAGQTTATATGLSAGTYTVIVTDDSNCSVFDVINITQPPLLTANITTINNSPCSGTGSSLTAAVAGGNNPYTYLWSPSGGTMPSATNLTAGSYTVTVTDANGCSVTASAIITQPPPLTISATPSPVSCFGGNNGSVTTVTNGGATPYVYLWSNGQATSSINGLTAGVYSVAVADANGCTATASATVTSPPQLTVNATGPASICSGSPATLSANPSGGIAPYIYNWAPVAGATASITTNPAATTTYTVTITDANGCSASASVTVGVFPPPQLSVSSNKSICSGESVTLSVSGTGTGFSWQPGGNTNASITVSPATTTTYTVTMSSDCGSTTGNITVTVSPMPTVHFSADVLSGCSPLCVQFRDLSTISSGNIAALNWTFGTGDSSNTPSPIYCYSSPGSFSVKLTAVSDNGCSATLSNLNYITVYSHPNAAFTASPQPTTILQPTIQFTDKSTDAYGISYWIWYFGDETDSTSQLENPSHTYKDTGTFCASLAVVNNKGCSDTVTNCLVISPIFTLYIPSAFTPNGDGINDVFIPKGNDIKSFEMYIFDRWGQQVFHSTNINQGWDGTLKGSTCQEDTYVYIITVYDSEGNEHKYTGAINLLK